MRLRRDPAGRDAAIEPDEAGGVVLIAGLGLVGFHRGIQQTPIALIWQGQSEGPKQKSIRESRKRCEHNARLGNFSAVS